MEEELQLNQWHRILIGNAPVEFLAEVLIRSVFLYLFLLVILRVMGKRMGGMLTISELAVMLTLGAIICVPMQIPDRGIFHGFLVLTCALIFQRTFTMIGQLGRKGEEITQGEEVVLVADGILKQEELYQTDISRQQLYAVLRSQGIYNLGAVERLYLEATGLFSVYPFKNPQPGLPLYPDRYSPKNHHEQKLNDVSACCDCGKTCKETIEPCRNCGGNTWTEAMTT